ncbi:unnamed protein product [Penicillium salamii]|nr:unnamed protein product [Penicillium salamii]
MGLLSKLNHIYSTLQALKAELTESKTTFDNLQSRISTPVPPVSNPTPSHWQNDPFQIPPQPLPTSTDIIIIGSGISGASIAYTLLRKSPCNILMLEARDVCSGATGRNGGHIKCSAYMEYCSFKDRFGESARHLLRFQKRHMELLLGLMGELGIEAEAREVETLDIFTDEKAWEDAKRMVHVFRTDMPEEAGDIVVFDGVDGCQEYRVNPEHCFGIIKYKAAALSPYKFITSLYGILQQNDNFAISPCTMVTEIHADGDGYSVSTSRGRIKAAQVVHATDGFAATLIPGLEGKIFPVRGHVTVQSGCGFDGSRSWCIHHKRGFDYISQRLGGELVVGGGVIQSPGRGIDEFGVWRDDGLCYSIRAYLGGLVETIFETQTKVEQAWSGCMGFTPDLLPFVGRLEESLTGRKGGGEWISAGFQGEGMVLAWLSGVAVGLMIAGDEEYQDEAGVPGGRVKEWLPRELICSKERVDRLSVSDLGNLL